MKRDVMEEKVIKSHVHQTTDRQDKTKFYCTFTASSNYKISTRMNFPFSVFHIYTIIFPKNEKQGTKTTTEPSDIQNNETTKKKWKLKVCVTHKHIIQKNRWFSTHLPSFLFAFLLLKKIFLRGNSFFIWFSSYYFGNIAKKEKEDWIRRNDKKITEKWCKIDYALRKNIKRKNISSMRPAAGRRLCRSAECYSLILVWIKWDERSNMRKWRKMIKHRVKLIDSLFIIKFYLLIYCSQQFTTSLYWKVAAYTRRVVRLNEYGLAFQWTMNEF